MKKIVNHIEIVFWDQAIRLMSESPLVQQSVRRGYRLSQQGKLVVPAFVVSTSAVGLVTGFLLGRSGISLW